MRLSAASGDTCAHTHRGIWTHADARTSNASRRASARMPSPPAPNGASRVRIAFTRPTAKQFHMPSLQRDRGIDQQGVRAQTRVILFLTLRVHSVRNAMRPAQPAQCQALARQDESCRGRRWSVSFRATDAHRWTTPRTCGACARVAQKSRAGALAHRSAPSPAGFARRRESSRTMQRARVPTLLGLRAECVCAAKETCPHLSVRGCPFSKAP